MGVRQRLHPLVSWEAHPVYFTVLMLLIPLIREVHFYLVHRLLHWPPLYRTVHKLHHNNVNPGPWSGLAMHPGEHLLYFSGVLIHWIVPSHPVHAMFHLLHAGLSPVPGHTGFDKLVVGDRARSIPTATPTTSITNISSAITPTARSRSTMVRHVS